MVAPRTGAWNWRSSNRSRSWGSIAKGVYDAQFKAERGHYPARLDDLIPANLIAIPNARNTLVVRRFGYDATRPALYFPAMFHGVFYYHFQTDDWTTNDEGIGGDC